MKLQHNNVSIMACMVPIKKSLSKQDKTDIIIFLNKLSEKYRHFGFHFSESTDPNPYIHIRLTCLMTKNPNTIISAYYLFKEKITTEIYPAIIKFLAEL